MSQVEYTRPHHERRSPVTDASKPPYTGPERRKSPREQFGGDDDGKNVRVK